MLSKGNTNLLIITVIILFNAAVTYSYYEWRPLGTANANGTNGNVYAITQYNGRIVVAGGFSNAGGVNVNNIAQWDPATSVWSPVGAGFNDTVYALYVYNSVLYAAGYFTMSGTTLVNRVARFNGTSWQPLTTGLDGEGRSLYQYGTDLIVGGDFTNAGGVPVNNIARWNGSAWFDLAGGVTGSGDRVLALTVYNSELIAAGRFQLAGSSPANNIAKWNGTTWSALGTGTDERIFALTVYNSELVAGGRFIVAGGITAHNIAKWNGTTWSNVGYADAFREDNEVNALTVFNGNLIVGGGFRFCDSLYVSRITGWNGSLWLTLSTGMNERIKALHVFGSDLYSGGEFFTAGGRYINHVARWINDSVVTVQGVVRYADNNNLVQRGIVRILRLDVATRQVIVIDQDSIVNGNYFLATVPRDSGDVVLAFPDDELDYVPTYYPSAIDWRGALPVHTFSNQVNININVYRILPEPENPIMATIGGKVFLNTMSQNPPASNYPYWSDAVVYVKSDSMTYKRFAISKTDRSYRTSELSPGVYQMFVSRLGYTTAARTITVGTVNLDSINFYLDSLNIIGLHNISSNVPRDFSLKQNYPNPFNPATTIAFSLPADGFAQLRIYDVLGREIASLVNERLNKGEYKYVYDAGNLPSGVYLYQLVINETGGDPSLRSGRSFTETKKMVLIK